MDHSFLSEVIHDKNQNDEPYVNWGIMENRTGNPRLALNYMRGLIPAYQKGGVSKITTQATGKNPDHYRNPNDKKNSQERWNGSTTWANLGFDFGERPGDEYFHPGNIADNVRDYLKFKHFDHPGTDEASDAKVKANLIILNAHMNSYTYLKSSPEFKKIGNHKDLFDAAVNYEYPANYHSTIPNTLAIKEQ